MRSSTARSMPRSNFLARYQGPCGKHGKVRRGEDPRRAAIGLAVVDVAQIVVHQPEAPRIDQDGLDQGLLGGDGAAIVGLDLGAPAQELEQVARGVTSE